MSSNVLQGFDVPFGCNVMENWFFAAPIKCPLVLQWKKEYKDAIETGLELYNSNNDKPDCLKTWLPYLTNHQSLHIARKKLPDENISTSSSTKKRKPYRLAAKCKWNNLCIVNKLKAQIHLDAPFYKINGSMRKAIYNEGIRKMSDKEKRNLHKFTHAERLLQIRIGNDKNNKTKYISYTFLFFVIVFFTQLINKQTS